MTLSPNAIETMRSLQLQAISSKGDNRIRARVKLIEFITEKQGAEAFRACLDAADEKIRERKVA